MVDEHPSLKAPNFDKMGWKNLDICDIISVLEKEIEKEKEKQKKMEEREEKREKESRVSTLFNHFTDGQIALIVKMVAMFLPIASGLYLNYFNLRSLRPPPSSSSTHKTKNKKKQESTFSTHSQTTTTLPPSESPEQSSP